MKKAKSKIYLINQENSHNKMFSLYDIYIMRFLFQTHRTDIRARIVAFDMNIYYMRHFDLYIKKPRTKHFRFYIFMKGMYQGTNPT